MKKRNMKNEIRAAFESETPNLRDKVLASCKKEAQLKGASTVSQSTPTQTKTVNYSILFRRAAACAVCLLLFISGLSLGLFIPDKNDTDTHGNASSFVYLDVNPSIELHLDDERRVADCVAGNGDAQAILLGLELEGVDLNTALTAIIGSMYVNGYLTGDSNSILVSVDGADEATTDSLLSDISGKINSALENSKLDCSIIAQSVRADSDLKERAKENGISVGKMHLVDKMISGIDELVAADLSELVNMSIRELNLIYSTRPNKGGGNDPFDKDISTGDIGGFLKEDNILSLLISKINIDGSLIEFSRMQARVHDKDGERRMVYEVSFSIKGLPGVYEFIIDSTTGEFISGDASFPEFDFSDYENREGQRGK